MSDAAVDVLGELKKLYVRYGGELSNEQLECFKHELRGLVPRGRYVTRLETREPVRVVAIGLKLQASRANECFVEYRPEAGSNSDSPLKLPVASFLEIYAISASEDTP